VTKEANYRDEGGLQGPRRSQIQSSKSAGWRLCSVLGLLEISDFGNEDEVMDKNGKTGRRYSAEEKAAAVRMVRTLRAELGTDYGPTGRAALQLGEGKFHHIQAISLTTLSY